MIRSAEAYYDDGAPYNGSNEMLLYDADGNGRRERVLSNSSVVRRKQQHLLQEEGYQMKQERHRRRDSSPGRFPEVLSKSVEAPPEKPSLRRAHSSPMDGLEQQQKHHHHRPTTPLSQRRIRSPSPGRYPEVDDDTVPKRPEFIGRHHPNFKPKKSILKKEKGTDISTAPASPATATAIRATMSKEDADDSQPTRGRTMDRDKHHHHHLIGRSRSRSNSLTPVREQRHFEDEDEEEVPSRPQGDGDGNDDDGDSDNSSSGTPSSSNDDDESSSSSSSELIVEDQFNASNEFQPPNEPPVQLPLLHEVLIHYQQQQEMMMQQQQDLHHHRDFQHQDNQVLQSQEPLPHVTVDPEDDVANERERELQFEMLLNSISGDDDNEVVNNFHGHQHDDHLHHHDHHRRHSYEHDQRLVIDDEGEIRPKSLSGSWRTYRLEHRYDEDDEQLERERELRFESVLEGIMSTPAESSATSTTDVGGGSSEIQQPPKQNRRSSNASTSAGSVASRSKSPKAMLRRSSLSSSVRTTKTATSVRSGRSKLSSTASFCYEYSKQFFTSSVSCLRCVAPGSNASSVGGRRRQARRPSGSISTRYASNSRREGEGRRIECLLPENWDGIDASGSSSRYSSPSPDIEATLRNRYEEIQNMPDMLNLQNSGLQYAGSFNRQSSGDLMMMDAASSHSNSSKGHSVDMTGKISPVGRSSPANDDILGLASPSQQQQHHGGVADIIVIRHAISCPRDHSDYGIGNVYDIVDTSESMKRILSSAKGNPSCRCRECKIKIEKTIGGALSGSKRNLIISLREKNHFYACRECQQQFICSTCWQKRGQLQKQTRRRRPQQEPQGSYYN